MSGNNSKRLWAEREESEYKRIYSSHLTDYSEEYKEELYLENLNSWEYSLDKDINFELHKMLGLKY